MCCSVRYSVVEYAAHSLYISSWAGVIFITDTMAGRHMGTVLMVMHRSGEAFQRRH